MLKYFLSALCVILLASNNVSATVSYSTDIADTITIADHADLTPSTLSVFAWIQPTDATENVIANKYNSGTSQRSWDFFVDGNDESHVTLSSSTSSFLGCTEISNSAVLSDGELGHIGFTYNGATNTVILYKNGSPIASTTTGTCPSSLANNTLDISIITNDSNSAHASGNIHDLSIFNKVLSVPEIELLSNSRIKRISLQISNLLVYLPLDDIPEGTSINSATFKDLSGNGHDGTGTDSDSDSIALAETVSTYP